MASVTGAIVFTDLVGFTEFTATSGDEEAVRLLPQTAIRWLTAALTSYVGARLLLKF